MSSLEKLYASPLQTAQEFAIVITGLGATVREKQTDTAHEFALMQVKSGNPVYAKCTPHAGRVHVEATDSALGNTQIYFLPWAKRCIYRVRPKPKNAPGVSENLFFTPNLDGCMVTIDGKLETPTIYHANAAGIQFTGEEEAAMRDVGKHGAEFSGEMENRLKIGRMARNTEVFKTILPKHPPLPSVSPSKTSNFDILAYDRGSRQITQPNDFDNVDIEQEVYYGAVFGVRKGGTWTFYKQSYRIFRKEWDVMESTFFGFGKPQQVRKKILEYSVVSAQQFWP